MSFPISERFSMRPPKVSRRGFFTLSLIGIPAAFFWVRFAKDRIDATLEYQSQFGTPVALDEEGNPIIKIGRIVSLTNEHAALDVILGKIPPEDTSAIVRKAPSQDSPELLRVTFLDNVEMIEVIGNVYPSFDSRGQKYILPENGKAYGQWFQITVKDDNTRTVYPGYLSGNFITVVGIKETSSAIEPPY